MDGAVVAEVEATGAAEVAAALMEITEEVEVDQALLV